MNLKDKIKKDAEKNLEYYTELLKALQSSDIKNKQERILQCEQSIKKQKQILSNISRWEELWYLNKDGTCSIFADHKTQEGSTMLKNDNLTKEELIRKLADILDEKIEDLEHLTIYQLRNMYDRITKYQNEGKGEWYLWI